MNIRLKKKIQDRLLHLEQQADNLKNQITELTEFDSIKEDLDKVQLEYKLDDTLKRIKHINAANKKFSLVD